MSKEVVSIMDKALGRIERGEVFEMHAGTETVYQQSHFHLRHMVYKLWVKDNLTATQKQKIAKYSAVHRATTEELKTELEQMLGGEGD